MAVVLIVAGGTLVWRFAAPTPSPGIQSLAILPLVNVSNDPEEDYLVDGLTDQLTAGVARATALRVISRTSAMQFKGSAQPLPQIARTLNVDAVVEGSVRRAGGRVWITAQLLDARTDRHLWARTYERGDDDLLALTGEVAADIGRELVGPAAVSGGAARRNAVVDPLAYERYLRGHWPTPFRGRGRDRPGDRARWP